MPDYAFKIIPDSDATFDVEIDTAVTRGSEDEQGYDILREFAERVHDDTTNDDLQETWNELMAVVGIDT